MNNNIKVYTNHSKKFAHYVLDHKHSSFTRVSRGDLELINTEIQKYLRKLTFFSQLQLWLGITTLDPVFPALRFYIFMYFAFNKNFSVLK